MCHAKLLADLAGVSRRARLVLHHTRAADHLEVGHFGKSSEDLILHAVREKGVVRIAAHIFKGKNRDTFLRNRSS